MKSAAMQYTDSMLANLENILKQSIEISTRDYNTMIGHLQEIDHVVTSTTMIGSAAAARRTDSADKGIAATATLKMSAIAFLNDVLIRFLVQIQVQIQLTHSRKS